jgi:hypothetical protein
MAEVSSLNIQLDQCNSLPNYKLIKPIGKGTYSTVYLCKLNSVKENSHKENKFTDYAFSISENDKFDRSSSMIENL